MLISIIIPCYQQEIYLERALDSIQLQNYHPLEVIIVDDGSVTPVTYPEKEYSFPINLIRKSNHGLSAARNTGIDNAAGELIKFLDADDTLLPGCLTAQAACIGKSPRSISVIGYKDIDEDSEISRDIYPAFGDVIPALMIDNLAPVHSFLFRKQDLIDAHGFDVTTRTSGGCEDYDLIFRMALNKASFISLHEVGVVYHRRSGSMSTNVENMKKAMLDVWLYNVSILLKSDEKMRSSYLIPILSGLSLRLDKRPILIPHEFDDLIIELVKKLNQLGSYLSPGESQLLLGFIYKHADLFPLYQPLRLISGSASSSISIKTQELLDYRVYLLGTGYRFDDQRLNKILSLGRKHNNRFAIYGAGEIGSRIYKLLQSAGIVPACLFDKNPARSNHKYNIPILLPSEIHSANIDAVVIASDAYYQEIYELLMSACPDIEVV